MAERSDRTMLVGRLEVSSLRLGWASGGQSVRLRDLAEFSTSDFTTASEPISAYLERTGRPDEAFQLVLACSGPVEGSRAEITNLGWFVDGDELGASTGVAHVKLINNLAAIAWSTPQLTASDLNPIGCMAATPSLKAPVVIFGSGGDVGVNAAVFIQRESGEAVVVGESGHCGFAPASELEAAVASRLIGRCGRATIEGVLSEAGFMELYAAVCAKAARHDPFASFPEVLNGAAAGDLDANRTLDAACGLWASIAGDVALHFGAKGGVLLTGSMVNTLLDRMRRISFREVFEDKPPMTRYLKACQTFVVTQVDAMLIGAARAGLVEGMN